MNWYIGIFLICGVLAQVDRNKYNALVSLTHKLAEDYYQCEAMYRYGSDVYTDFKEFWNPKRALLQQEMGCLLLCMGVQRNFIDNEGNLIEENVMDAIRAVNEPALDAAAIKVMKSLGYQCHREVKQKANTHDACINAIRHSQCMRFGLIKLKWAPGPGQDYRRILGLPSDIINIAKETEEASDYEDINDPDYKNETRNNRIKRRKCT